MKKWVSVATSLLMMTPVFSHANVDAVQLQVAALDSSVDCNRMFFQGSSSFSNTIFVMPRIIQGGGPDDKRSIEIIPKTDGNYIMKVRIFFPTNDSYLKTSTTSSATVDREACNFDEVMDSLNARISDPSKKVLTTSDMPLTSVELEIPGIRELGNVGGTEDESAFVLDYAGKAMTFVFNINEEEKDFIEGQAVTLDGLLARVKVRFQGRSPDGSVKVKINTSQLQANFLAQAKGKTFLAEGEVSAALRMAMDSSAVSIVAEAGSNERSDDTIKKVINKVLSEVAVTSLPTETPDSGATKVTDLKTGAATRVAVKAVVEVISKLQESFFSFSQIGAPEIATAQRELRFRANRLQDANLMEIAIQAAYQDPSAGINLRAGQTIAISPAYTYVDDLKYKDHKTFITKSMISELDLAQYFEEITSGSMSIESKTINEISMAIGTWSTLGVPNPGSYRWVQIERIPVRTRGKTDVYKRTLEVLKSIPVAISFTGLGERYQVQLAGMISENNWWKGRFDEKTGRMFITAKKDLGRITFRESMRGKDNLQTADVVTNEVIMQSESVFGKITPYKRVIFTEDKEALVKQRTIVLYMSRPLKDQQNADLESKDNKELLKPATTFTVNPLWWKLDKK